MGKREHIKWIKNLSFSCTGKVAPVTCTCKKYVKNKPQPRASLPLATLLQQSLKFFLLDTLLAICPDLQRKTEEDDEQCCRPS